MEELKASVVVRFGVYELDLRAGELRRQGVKIKLQEQPFQVLALLSERSGEVVTREELRQKLWPGDTFVDFDHSLSTAIGKIREALGDSADNPRFLETVARRGYRLIAPVRRLEPNAHLGLDPGSRTHSPNMPSASATSQGDANSRDGSLLADPALQAEIPPTTTAAQTSLQDASGARQSTAKGVAQNLLETMRSRYSFGLMLTIVLLLVALALAAMAYFRHESRNADAIRLSLLLPENVKFSDMEAPVLSPDGRLLAFVARNSSGESWLWARPLNSMTAQVLPETEGASQPFWSPDSHWIGYFSKGKLKKIEVSSGTSQTLCDSTQGSGGTWNRDGVIVFSPAYELYRVAAAGGEPTRLTKLDGSRRELVHWWPYFLPDGRHFLYLVYSAQPDTRGIYLGSLDSEVKQRLVPADSSSAYAPPGYILFIRNGALLAQQFDPKHLQLGIGTFSVTQDVANSIHSLRGAFSVSESGVIAFWRGGSIQLAWFDRTGKRLGSLGPPGPYSGPAISPDEKRVAVEAPDPQSGAPDIWLIELARGVSTRFTFDPAPDQGAVWSPDATSIAFSSVRDGTWDFYREPSNGASKEEVLLKASENEYVSDWSRDGRFIAYDSLNPKGDWDMWVLPLFGDRKPIPFLHTEFNELNSQFSPDGRWISYVSNESGRYEVYVRPFPASNRRWLVSTGGGSGASWRRDGKELFYVAPDAKLMAVTIEADTNFKMSVPKVLFDTRSINACGYQYAATNDGQRFLVPVEEGASTPFNVVVNWTAELKR